MKKSFHFVWKEEGPEGEDIARKAFHHIEEFIKNRSDLFIEGGFQLDMGRCFKADHYAVTLLIDRNTIPFENVKIISEKLSENDEAFTGATKEFLEWDRQPIDALGCDIHGYRFHSIQKTGGITKQKAAPEPVFIRSEMSPGLIWLLWTAISAAGFAIGKAVAVREIMEYLILAAIVATGVITASTAGRKVYAFFYGSIMAFFVAALAAGLFPSVTFSLLSGALIGIAVGALQQAFLSVNLTFHREWLSATLIGFAIASLVSVGIWPGSLIALGAASLVLGFDQIQRTLFGKVAKSGMWMLATIAGFSAGKLVADYLFPVQLLDYPPFWEGVGQSALNGLVFGAVYGAITGGLMAWFLTHIYRDQASPSSASPFALIQMVSGKQK